MAKKQTEADNVSAKQETCGLIMPISAIDGYSSEHWSEVKDIISESVEDAGFTPKLVSDASDTGIIHQRIIENIYANPIVVCDISSRNPNVMFELGVRLTFDKPVVIIRDDSTERIFDTDIIEYLVYPKGLRYNSIQLFKKALTEKVKATYSKYQDPATSFFIKNFRNVKAQKLEEEELNSTQLILRAIEGLKRDNTSLKPSQATISKQLRLTRNILLQTFNHCLDKWYGYNFSKMQIASESELTVLLRETFLELFPEEATAISEFSLSNQLSDLVFIIANSSSADGVRAVFSR